MGLCIPFVAIFLQSRLSAVDQTLQSSEDYLQQTQKTQNLTICYSQGPTQSFYFQNTQSLIQSYFSKSIIDEENQSLSQQQVLLQSDQLPKNDEQEKIQKLSFAKSFYIKRVLLNFISTVNLNTTYFMLEPYLQPEFKSYGVSDFMVSFFFSIVCIAYIIPLLFLFLIPEHLDRRVLIGASCIVTGITLLPIGHILFEKNLAILIIGLSFYGAVSSLGIIPSVSDNQEGIKEKYQQAPESQISNQVAGITNLALSTPKIVGPPLGGLILDHYHSFKILVLYDFILILATGIVYIILNDPHKAYRSFKKKPTKDENISASAL